MRLSPLRRVASACLTLNYNQRLFVLLVDSVSFPAAREQRPGCSEPHRPEATQRSGCCSWPECLSYWSSLGSAKSSAATESKNSRKLATSVSASSVLTGSAICTRILPSSSVCRITTDSYRTSSAHHTYTCARNSLYKSTAVLVV